MNTVVHPGDLRFLGTVVPDDGSIGPEPSNLLRMGYYIVGSEVPGTSPFLGIVTKNNPCRISALGGSAKLDRAGYELAAARFQFSRFDPPRGETDDPYPVDFRVVVSENDLNLARRMLLHGLSQQLERGESFLGMEKDPFRELQEELSESSRTGTPVLSTPLGRDEIEFRYVFNKYREIRGGLDGYQRRQASRLGISIKRSFRIEHYFVITRLSDRVREAMLESDAIVWLNEFTMRRLSPNLGVPKHHSGPRVASVRHNGDLRRYELADNLFFLPAGLRQRADQFCAKVG